MQGEHRDDPAAAAPSPADSRAVAVVGAGSIGAAFALLFACGGGRVSVHDPDAGRRERLLAGVRASWRDLREFQLVEGDEDDLLSRIEVSDALAATVAGAAYVQECAPEDRDLKREVFAQLDALTPPDTVLASSSSAITASEFAAALPGRDRCLVVHPGNPPFLLRVAEIVPAPFTSRRAVTRARALLASIGLATVTLRREVTGFVFNRLQGALLREAYCLVRDGVADVEEIDRVVRDGLGLRWAVTGPFETVDLNTRGGIESHAAKLGPAYARMGAERGQNDPWTLELVGHVTARRRALLPLERWEERVRWRDRSIMALLAARARRGTE